MPATTKEILDQTILHYLVSERIPSSEEITRARKFGGVLIHLSPGELITHYDKWQEYHHEHPDEPFAGHLVKATAELGTDSDLDLDVMEAALEKKVPISIPGVDNPEVARLIAEHVTGVFFKEVVSSEDRTIESVKVSELAKLIATVAIEYSVHEQLLFEEREFYINGDPQNVEFLKSVYQRISDELEHSHAEAEAYDETSDPIGLDTELSIYGSEEADMLAIAREDYEAKFEKFSGLTTAVQAGRQLQKESANFDYTYIDNY